MGGALEAAAAGVLLETVGEGGVKPYAYLKAAHSSNPGVEGVGTGGDKGLSLESGSGESPSLANVCQLSITQPTGEERSICELEAAATGVQLKTVGEGEVKAYAYLEAAHSSNPGGEGVGTGGDKGLSLESGSGESPSLADACQLNTTQPTSDELSACVARATAAALRALNLAPIQGTVEVGLITSAADP